MEEALNELILKAFKLVTRAVRFVDLWNESNEVDMWKEKIGAQATEGSIDASMTAQDENRDATVAQPTTFADQANPGEVTRKDVNVDFPREVDAPVPSWLESTTMANGNNEGEANIRPRSSRASQIYVRAGASPSNEQPLQLLSTPPMRNSGTHRISYSTHSPDICHSSLVSEKLNETHNSFLSLLSNFAGPHLLSRSTSELIHGAEQAVNSCCVLLAVVEAVWEQDLKRSDLLEQTRNDMHGKLQDLLTAARDALRPAQADDKDIFDGQRLADTATACVRCAGECVAKTRFVIEKIGDFEFETTGLGISNFADFDFQPPSLTADKGSESTQNTFMAHETSNSLEPSSEPPRSSVYISSTPCSIDTSITPDPDVYSLGGCVERTVMTSFRSSAHSMPHSVSYTASPLVSPPLVLGGTDSQGSQTIFSTSSGVHVDGIKADRSDSIDESSIESECNYVGSMRDSETSILSSTITRSTSPDMLSSEPYEISSVNRIEVESSSALDEDPDATEAKVLEKTFAHELVHNKDGQITGGSLPALIERLTSCDSTPDMHFTSIFYLTFRSFTTPSEFAQALIDRFEYVQDSPQIALPVRLRVYNAFKNWLDSHWRSDCDKAALGLILPFAAGQLSAAHPSAGKRLTETVGKMSNISGPSVPRLVSSMGKTNTAAVQYVSPDTPLPMPIISKSQLSALRNWKNGGASISILDFEPLELARQLTIKESRIFCSILPEELLDTEWMKPSSSRAVNVRAMSTISNDLANLVVDCILQSEDAHKRAKLIKQWIKIANKCLELNNYDSLMAIICSLNSSTISRLKRTWDMISAKTKTTLERLGGILEVSRNYAVLRQRLQTLSPPCLPFVGMYLTDLSFVDIGNQPTRQLPSEGGKTVSVINFDKHMKTAKIISDLQRFQSPYRLMEVPELQTWMQDQFVRVRSAEQSTDQSAFQSYYRRSLLLEPREPTSTKSSSVEPPSKLSARDGGRERFDMFNLMWPHPSKEKLVAHQT